MSNAEQVEYWNGEAGNNWVAQAESLDLMLHDLVGALLDRAALRHGQRVFDIGCGSGATTLAAQERVGPNGQAIGLDISKQLLRNAQRRASEKKSPASFIEADASTWTTDTKADAIISRFGVMFFDEPVTTFANMRKLLTQNGTMTLACWRSPKENDIGGGVMSATAHLFTPPATKPDPIAPGPFAFSDQAYFDSILSKARWRDVHFEKWDAHLPLPFDTARENAIALSQMGGPAKMAREQNVPREKVVEALTKFLEQRVDGQRYYLIGAVWIVSARA